MLFVEFDDNLQQSNNNYSNITGKIILEDIKVLVKWLCLLLWI